MVDWTHVYSCQDFEELKTRWHSMLVESYTKPQLNRQLVSVLSLLAVCQGRLDDEVSISVAFRSRRLMSVRSLLNETSTTTTKKASIDVF